MEQKKKPNHRRLWSTPIGVFIVCILLSSCAVALQSGPNDVFVRVVDSGAALCCVVEMPGDKYMIYDAGNYTDGGSQTFEKIQEVIPAGSDVELLVLSHSDADHIGAVDEICDAYRVRRVLRSGYRRPSNTWITADSAIRQEKETENCIDINLRYFEYPMGATYRFGKVFVTMVCGFHEPPESWGNLSQSEGRNAGSIVVRLLYKGKSILFCGDAVGRHTGDPNDVCIATEKYMVENAEAIPIDSDILIAPHHGADNASSTKFVRTVSPEYVVFSAGHRYQHPRAAAAQRYISNGVLLNRIFRTDLGDDEQDNREWTEGRIQNNTDGAGDDDVDILIRSNGTIRVEYRNP